MRAFGRLTPTTQVCIAIIAAFALWLGLNWAYQVMRKPSELFFPISGVLHKLPAETWEAYGPVFRRHSTAVISPDLLAALAQVEGSGNPVARTYWRWSLAHGPFGIYRPASSAVGMYQITNGTFAEARRYCIHDHAVVEDGPWNDLKSCWFNSFYTRVVPWHAVEMTSAYLDRRVEQSLGRLGARGATLQQRQDMATVIHLCGAAAGEAYAKRRFRPAKGQRCGDHDLRGYLKKVAAMRATFRELAQAP